MQLVFNIRYLKNLVYGKLPESHLVINFSVSSPTKILLFNTPSKARRKNSREGPPASMAPSLWPMSSLNFTLILPASSNFFLSTQAMALSNNLRLLTLT